MMVLTLKGALFALAALFFLGALLLTIPPLESWRVRAQCAGLLFLSLAWMLWSGGK